MPTPKEERAEKLTAAWKLLAERSALLKNLPEGSPAHVSALAEVNRIARDIDRLTSTPVPAPPKRSPLPLWFGLAVLLGVALLAWRM